MPLASLSTQYIGVMRAAVQARYHCLSGRALVPACPSHAWCVNSFGSLGTSHLYVGRTPLPRRPRSLTETAVHLWQAPAKADRKSQSALSSGPLQPIKASSLLLSPRPRRKGYRHIRPVFSPVMFTSTVINHEVAGPMGLSIGVSCVSAEALGSLEGLATWMEDRLPAGREAVSLWGQKPGTKRLANLWTELLEGETVLEDLRPPRRRVQVVSVKIVNARGQRLLESHQEMASGDVRWRNRFLSEKMRPGESVLEACRRGVLEELGPELGSEESVVLDPSSHVCEEEERESCSYPGLLTRYVLHTVQASGVKLSEDEFVTLEEEHFSGDALGGKGGNGAAANEQEEGLALGVRKHFWVWRSEEFCRQITLEK